MKERRSALQFTIADFTKIMCFSPRPSRIMGHLLHRQDPITPSHTCVRASAPDSRPWAQMGFEGQSLRPAKFPFFLFEFCPSALAPRGQSAIARVLRPDAIALKGGRRHLASAPLPIHRVGQSHSISQLASLFLWSMSKTQG